MGFTRWQRRLIRMLSIAAIAALLAAAIAPAFRHDSPSAPHVNLAKALSGAAPGFARAQTVRSFSFPADQGPHPDFRTEWWYWTGNLEADGNRRFGYQYTLFRVGLTPGALAVTAGGSAWSTNQIYFAHLALSDPIDHRFIAVHDEVRGAVGLAGARADPLRVWIGDWQVSGWNPCHLQARHPGAEPFALDLMLSAGKPIVLEGDHGLSAKGGGGSSYYYSCTRMPTRGRITTPNGSFAVQGDSWMDREWSTTALSGAQVGWDWFALQLGDGRDLMLYRMRLAAGGADPASSGTVVAVDGAATHLTHAQFTIDAGGSWTSPHGDVYPAAWHVQVPSAGIDCQLTPVMSDQELDVGFRYWEGAVDISGTQSGRGYVELTGYDQRHLAASQP